MRWVFAFASFIFIGWKTISIVNSFYFRHEVQAKVEAETHHHAPALQDKGLSFDALISSRISLIWSRMTHKTNATYYGESIDDMEQDVQNPI